ncbi:hypothetical protein Hrd1104_11925 [Halorhabdus sp. CBA1104]|uniref:hypothetical protein n=1 Tax=Halorhabdus sp. CBA1104 TaxID=1380432 RepID=UPI0012B3B119|nr:hypothetical protein [Halorhabdus sp. CBA1104]QGN07930.1 hypothetical protein Hrd1104_11925 [Halorhabdus sp. CBA1104]
MPDPSDQERVEVARKTLTDAVAAVRAEHPVEETLQELRDQGQRWWERDDVIWFEIVLSLSTLRGSYGSQIVVDDDGEIDEHLYGSVAFDTLAQIDEDHRNQYLEARLYGNVAMHPTKAEALESNFELIENEYGDPKRAKEAFIEADGIEEKLEFLKQFSWIGQKYARNIPMDLYLEEFRDFIAIDTRIEGLLEKAEYPLESRTYDEHEAFLQEVAQDLGVNSWALDRILYNYNEEIDSAL